jgi:hypothetical protein
MSSQNEQKERIAAAQAGIWRRGTGADKPTLRHPRKIFGPTLI